VRTFRTKLAIAAVIFGLGGLGGYAMASNPAASSSVAGARAGSQAGQPAAHVTTGSSGAVGAPAINVPASAALPRNTGEGGQDD
jgi:hypothetical protein